MSSDISFKTQRQNTKNHVLSCLTYPFLYFYQKHVTLPPFLSVSILAMSRKPMRHESKPTQHISKTSSKKKYHKHFLKPFPFIVYLQPGSRWTHWLSYLWWTFTNNFNKIESTTICTSKYLRTALWYGKKRLMEILHKR